MIIVPPDPDDIDTAIYLPDKRIRRLRPGRKPADLHLYEPNWAHPLAPQASLFLMDGKRCLAWDGQRPYLGIENGTNGVITRPLAGGQGASYENAANEDGTQLAIHDVEPPGELAEGYIFAHMQIDSQANYSYIYAYPHTSGNHRLYLIANEDAITFGGGSDFFVAAGEILIATGEVFTVCFSWRSGTFDSYINGKLMVSGSSFAGSNPGGENADYTAIGALSSAALSSRSGFDGTVNMLGVGNRYLNAGEATVLTRDPYQILKRKSAPMHTRNAHASHAGYFKPPAKRWEANRAPTDPMNYRINRKDMLGKGLKFFGVVTAGGLYDIVNGDLYPLPNATVIATGHGFVADYPLSTTDTITLKHPWVVGDDQWIHACISIVKTDGASGSASCWTLQSTDAGQNPRVFFGWNGTAVRSQYGHSGNGATTWMEPVELDNEGELHYQSISAFKETVGDNLEINCYKDGKHLQYQTEVKTYNDSTPGHWDEIVMNSASGKGSQFQVVAVWDDRAPRSHGWHREAGTNLFRVIERKKPRIHSENIATIPAGFHLSQISAGKCQSCCIEAGNR